MTDIYHLYYDNEGKIFVKITLVINSRINSFFLLKW